jgi:hypothetical protein
MGSMVLFFVGSTLISHCTVLRRRQMSQRFSIASIPLVLEYIISFSSVSFHPFKNGKTSLLETPLLKQK